MEVVEPYARMLDVPDIREGIYLLRKVEAYARVSHRSEDAITPDSWERIIQSVVLNHGDFSVTEHVTVTVEAEVDRGISHEWVRHRIGAYTQESTRFVNYTKQTPLRFVMPTLKGEESKIAWKNWIELAEALYNRMIEVGESPQMARSILPTCTATRLIVTYNLRAWRHFLLMRTCREAHPQMRQVTVPLLEEFKQKIPLLYDDITPDMKQSEAMRLMR